MECTLVIGMCECNKGSDGHYVICTHKDADAPTQTDRQTHLHMHTCCVCKHTDVHKSTYVRMCVNTYMYEHDTHTHTRTHTHTHTRSHTCTPFHSILLPTFARLNTPPHTRPRTHSHTSCSVVHLSFQMRSRWCQIVSRRSAL